MSLRIIKAGVLDTLQDGGRYGYQHWGINPGGAMDKWAMQVANLLAGNTPGTVVLEMHFPAPVLLFQQPTLIALSGADFSATLNGDPIPHLHPVFVSKNSILQFHKIQRGARAYLAIRGGWDIPAWLGSFSTHLKAGAGGYRGRALQKDDQIGFCEMPAVCSLLGKKEFLVCPWRADDQWDAFDDGPILLLPGHEWDRLTAAAKEKLPGEPFLVTHQSDRMGYRLQGEALDMEMPEELISSAVSFGTVQGLPDGQLTVLMADHQTTGGYPRIGHVIAAHHSRLAQLKPGEMLRFGLTDQPMAEKFWIKQQQHLLQLQNACTFRLGEFIN